MTVRRTTPVPCFWRCRYRTALDFINVPLLRVAADADISGLHHTIRDLRPVPHVLVNDEEKLHTVLPSALLRLQLWLKVGGLAKMGDIKGSPFVVVRADAQLFDIVATMRAHHRDVALITREGELQRAEDVLGVVTWADIIEHSNLPHHMLLLNRPNH